MSELRTDQQSEVVEREPRQAPEDRTGVGSQESGEVEVVGHYLVNTSTGEIVGLVDEQTERFRVHDQASAEWVMEKLADAESGVAAVRARRKVLLENLEAMEREHAHRVAWLKIRFTDELAAWAAAELEGKKARSLKTPWGTLAFRRKPARVVVTDEEAAVAFLEAQGHNEAVKVKKSVLVSMLPPTFLFGATENGFSVEPESDGFSVKTGLL